MSFKADKMTINDVLTKSVFSIPRNQRRYVWKNNNIEDLFSDVLFSIQSKRSHFIGSIVLELVEEKNGLSYYRIIDGQQRLITINLALVALMKLFLENDMDDAFQGTISYLQSKDNRNKSIINIQSDYHLSIDNIIGSIIQLTDKKASITSFLNTNTVSKQKDKNVINAVKNIYSFIKKRIENNENPEQASVFEETDAISDKLIKIRDALIDMIVIRIVSDSDEDSYTIFEILNARGQDLEPSELIKNYIMRYIYPEENRDIAKQQWEEMENLLGSDVNIKHFFNHYVVHKYSVSGNERINPYHVIQKEEKSNHIRALLKDIILKSKYYKKLIDPSTDEAINCSANEVKIFTFFKKKKVEQFRPVLLSAMHQKEQENISEEEYNLFLRYLYVFYICYAIIGEEKSNKLHDVIRKYSPIIENNCSDTSIAEFCNVLKKKIPGDKWFYDCFSNIGWSKHFERYKGEENKHRVQLVLELIEEFVSQTNVTNEFTIEHMLPDNESENNAQIGNLIPLEENLNGNLKDKPLSQKYDTYSKSNYSSARGVSRQYKDKDFDPKKRTDFLAKLIYNNILELKQFDFSDD